VTDLVERLNAGIDVANRRLLTLRTQQDIEVALVFREILVETRDEIERLGRELTEARDGFKEAMSDHADTLDRLAEAERWAKRASAACHGAINLPELYVAIAELRRLTTASTVSPVEGE
jgi:hypothetical protein